MLIDQDKGITLGSTYTFLNSSRVSRTSEHPGETKPIIDSAVTTFMPKTGLHLHPGETKPRIDSAVATFMGVVSRIHAKHQFADLRCMTEYLSITVEKYLRVKRYTI